MKKTVLITGASRGIGKACAILYSMKGYNVAVNYNRSKEQAEALVSDIIKNGGSAKAYCADVSNYDAVFNMVDEVINNFGGIDVLINNAGIALYGQFTDITADMWNKIRSINLDGAVYCAEAVLPHMVKKHSGRIINISSIWGVQGASCEAHYSTTKAGVIGLTKSLAKEYGPAGITVNCIAPGVIDTEMIACLDDEAKQELIEKTPLRRLGTVYDVANTALFLASSGADFITGQIIGVDGGL